MRDPAPFTYTPTRRTQPYRQPLPGPTWQNMSRGRTLGGMNPADYQRALAAARPGSLWWQILSMSSPTGTLR